MWWFFAIASALCQVGRNATMKKLGHSLDEYINVWGRFFFLLPFALVASYLKGFPEVGRDYWIYSFFAGLAQVFSTLLLSKSFKYGAISVSIAIWKLQVIFLAICGVIFLEETVHFWGGLGIFISFSGIYLLNIKQAQVSWIEPLLLLIRDKGMRYALLAALTLTPTILLFKKTAQLGDPFFSTLTNYIFASLIVFPIIMQKSAKHFLLLPRYFIYFLSLGLFAALATIFGSFGYIQSVAAYVEAVKQIEIPLTLLVGSLFFKETQCVKDIWPGCLLLMVGLVILIFTS